MAEAAACGDQRPDDGEHEADDRDPERVEDDEQRAERRDQHARARDAAPSPGRGDAAVCDVAPDPSMG